jgi:hypothetical protein
MHDFLLALTLLDCSG